VIGGIHGGKRQKGEKLKEQRIKNLEGNTV
jgi:hypothetical protein